MRRTFGFIVFGGITIFALFVALMFLQGYLSPSNVSNAHLNLEGVARAFSSIKFEIGGHQYNFVESVTDLFNWFWGNDDGIIGLAPIKEWIQNGGFNFTANIGNNILSVADFLGRGIAFFAGMVVAFLKAPLMLIALLSVSIYYVLSYVLQIILLVFSIGSGGFIIFT